MLSTLDNHLKRSAEDAPAPIIKKVRFSERISNRGTKRRNEEDVLESTKRNRMTPKGIKRSSDTLLEHPVKRMKTTHTFLQQIIRMMTGCRIHYDHNYEGDAGGNNPLLIPIVA